MKCLRTLVIYGLVLLARSSPAAEYLLRLKGAAPPQGLRVLKRFEAFGVSYAVVESAEGSLRSLSSMRGVSRAEPNHRYSLQMGGGSPSGPDGLEDFDPRPVLPNDPQFTHLWGLLNYGQKIGNSRGLRHFDAAIAQGWNLERGSRRSRIAVFDTGVDYQHPDLNANLWNSAGSFGYDAEGQDADVMDGHSHGTHVSGTIGAVGNNDVGVTGINWAASIVTIKIFDAAGVTSDDAILRALDWTYSNREGIRVINHSWGGNGYSEIVEDAFKILDDAGIVNVFAAGNEASSLVEEDRGEDMGFYPAMYRLENSIVVAASGNGGVRASFSNYGPGIVDITAPGRDVYSTVPGGGYAYKSGTSMAAPHVTGVMGLLFAQNPGLSARQAKERLLRNADLSEALRGVSTEGRSLNAWRALKEGT
jgi:subtilisin family serine protease